MDIWENSMDRVGIQEDGLEPMPCLTASSFDDVCILQKKLVSLEASGLGLEKLKEEPREIVAAEGLAVGLAVSPDQGETADQ